MYLLIVKLVRLLPVSVLSLERFKNVNIEDKYRQGNKLQSPIGGVSSRDGGSFRSIQAVINKIGNDPGTFVINPQ